MVQYEKAILQIMFLGCIWKKKKKELFHAFKLRLCSHPYNTSHALIHAVLALQCTGEITSASTKAFALSQTNRISTRQLLTS